MIKVTVSLNVSSNMSSKKVLINGLVLRHYWNIPDVGPVTSSGNSGQCPVGPKRPTHTDAQCSPSHAGRVKRSAAIR